MNPIPTRQRVPLSGVPDVPWNAAMMVGDVACYLIAMAFLDTATTLPALVQMLGGDAAFLGMLLAIRSASGYLAPLLVAYQLQGTTRFKPLLLWAALSGRLALFPAVLIVWLFGKTLPTLALSFLTLALIAAWLGDGAGTVPWTALVGKIIPMQIRGRLFALTQMVSGISRLLVSGLVAVLLAGKAVPFPGNAAVLVLLCAAVLLVSWCFIAGFREPEDNAPRPAPQQPPPDLRTYFVSLPGRFRERPALLLLAVAQILVTAAGASIPFLGGYAVSLGAALPRNLPGVLQQGMTAFEGGGLPGLFLAAQTVGLLVFAPFWGWLNDHYGPRKTLTGLFLLALLCPLFALLGGWSGGTLAFFILAYFCYGGVMDSWMPITNYLIESVPTEEQATFLSLMNAASAPALILPLIAGFVVEKAGGPPLYLGTIVLLVAGYFFSVRLPDTRRRTAGSAPSNRTRPTSAIP